MLDSFGLNFFKKQNPIAKIKIIEPVPPFARVGSVEQTLASPCEGRCRKSKIFDGGVVSKQKQTFYRKK